MKHIIKDVLIDWKKEKRKKSNVYFQIINRIQYKTKTKTQKQYKKTLQLFVKISIEKFLPKIKPKRKKTPLVPEKYHNTTITWLMHDALIVHNANSIYFLL